MIKQSKKALGMWERLCFKYDTFWEYAMEELDGTTIAGSDHAYEVFKKLEYSKTWTYFWTGDVYVLFPCIESTLLKGLKDQKRKQEEADQEEVQEIAAVATAPIMPKEIEVTKWHKEIKPIEVSNLTFTT